MVERKNQSGVEMLFAKLKTMTEGEFLPYFYPWELARISRLNKASHHLIKVVVNF
jgi:hypothetical protein